MSAGQMTPMRLIVIEGVDLGTVFVFADAAKVLGRAKEADIRLKGRGVSRRHARLVRAFTGEVLVVDLGSANGTFVNDQAITTTMLRAGDRLRLGFDVVLQVERHASDERDTADLQDVATLERSADEPKDAGRCLEMIRPMFASS